MPTNIIGGADGSTAIFVTGRFGGNWLNVLGLVIVVLMLLPNLVYAWKFREQKNLCTNKGMNILEQLGRFGSMFFMIFSLGKDGFGFASVGAFLAYGFGNVILLLGYWIAWGFFFHKRTKVCQMVLAVIPAGIFLLCGLTLRNIPLLITAVLFGISHVYVTRCNPVAE